METWNRKQALNGKDNLAVKEDVLRKMGVEGGGLGDAMAETREATVQELVITTHVTPAIANFADVDLSSIHIQDSTAVPVPFTPVFIAAHATVATGTCQICTDPASADYGKIAFLAGDSAATPAIVRGTKLHQKIKAALAVEVT